MKSKQAWESGARSWTPTDRRRYANDLGFGGTLEVVNDDVNSAKGDRDPALWLPSLAANRCNYAILWLRVKYRWRLTMDTAERTKLSSILTGSCGAKNDHPPAPGPPPPPTP